ncbi:hypothetical protein C8Q76DRAFT_797804 [Earliella scabrosa]|nr:hypothetical protein C8Q76DRAFT_797804 [Earliella scabrosa]
MPKVDTGKHVMEILRMAHSLNFLSLLDMDTELFPPAELKSTLAQLPLLEHLYLGQTEDVHQDLIADILPNLRSVISQFRFIDRRIGNEDLETYHAFPGLPPLPLLRSHTNVLQSLSLCWVHLPKNLPPFPNVRRLELSLWSAPGGLRTLLTAFPNIEDLTIGPPRVDTVLDGSIFIQGEEEAATAEAQRASNRTLTSQWSRIRRIACVNALALYWLGLQYAVDQVEVREIDATSRMLETILNDLRPRCLTLLTHSRLMNLFVDPSKRTLNLLPQAPYVTHLVQLARVDRRERVRVLNTLAVHLRRSAVSHLLVAFEATAGEERFRWKEFDAQPETLTRLLTDAIPSLRYLFIQVGAHTPRLKGWMKHTTENGGWRELSSGFGSSGPPLTDSSLYGAPQAPP